MDLDLQGVEFTWSNKRVGNECIQAHLDRVLISPDQTKDFVCNNKAIQKISSGHFPLLFMVEAIQDKKNFPFRFEKMWMQHSQFEDQLVKWCNINIEGTTLFRVASKIKNVKKKVREWNKRYFGNIFESN